MQIEMRALIDEGANVRWAHQGETAQFYGIYQGEPGSFEWVADFGTA